MKVGIKQLKTTPRDRLIKYKIMYKIFNKKYVDVSKIVGISIGCMYDTNDNDCLVVDIQLLDKPLVIEHPQANFRNQTVNVKEEVEKELNHILTLINKPVETTNQEPLFTNIEIRTIIKCIELDNIYLSANNKIDICKKLERFIV